MNSIYNRTQRLSSGNQWGVFEVLTIKKTLDEHTSILHRIDDLQHLSSTCLLIMVYSSPPAGMFVFYEFGSRN